MFVRDIFPQFQPFSHLFTIFPTFYTETYLFPQIQKSPDSDPTCRSGTDPTIGQNQKV